MINMDEIRHLCDYVIEGDVTAQMASISAAVNGYRVFIMGTVTARYDGGPVDSEVAEIRSRMKLNRSGFVPPSNLSDSETKKA